MPLFVMMGHDHPGAFELRETLRPAHKDYVMANIAPLRLAGALTDEQDRQIGSMLVLDLESLEAAKAWFAVEPFTVGGLYARVDLRPWGVVYGQISDTPQVNV